MIMGIMGLAGSGKTTLAQHVSKKYNINCISVANPIKVELASRGITKANQPDLYRKESIKLGKDMRNENPNCFVDTFKRKIESAPGQYVFDDIRYMNEIEAIHELGGKILFLFAIERIKPDLSKYPYTDISEKLAIDVSLSRIDPYFVDLSIHTDTSDTEETMFCKFEQLAKGLF